MRWSSGFVAVVSTVAVVASAASASAQQNGASRNRLMFDATSMEGSPRHTGTVQQPAAAPQPATTGQRQTPQYIAPAEQTAQTTPTPAAKPAASVPAASVPAASAPPATKPAAVAAPKPAAPPRPAQTQARRPAQGTEADKYTLSNSEQRPSDRPVPREQPQSLGRVSLPGASLGYEGQTQVKSYDMDGRRVPGTENFQRNDPSYFGLSLRMRTDQGSGGIGSLFRSHSPD